MDQTRLARARRHARLRHHGGVSSGEYASMNLGAHSGDDAARREEPCDRLASTCPIAALDEAGAWHVGVADLDRPVRGRRRPPPMPPSPASQGASAVVLTADCMPLFFTNVHGTRVGVAHAGWRGMAAGVIEATVKALGSKPPDVLAWMGPAIGPSASRWVPKCAQHSSPSTRERRCRLRPPRRRQVHGGPLRAGATAASSAPGVRSVSGGGFCT